MSTINWGLFVRAIFWGHFLGPFIVAMFWGYFEGDILRFKKSQQRKFINRKLQSSVKFMMYLRRDGTVFMWYIGRDRIVFMYILVKQILGT